MDLKSKTVTKKLLLICIALIINNYGFHYSQDRPLVSTGKLKFYFDTSSFRGKADSTCQEFYLMFHADQINELNINSKASFSTVAGISKSDGELVSSSKWITSVDLINDMAESKKMVVFDQWNQNLLPGNYNISISISIDTLLLSGQLNGTFDVKKMDVPSLQISDIQFVFKTDELKENSIFNKAGLNVLPNVWRRYGVLNPNLIFYYEIYGIDTSYNESLFAEYKIIAPDRRVVKTLNEVPIKRTATQRSVLHIINVESLPSSTYELSIIIIDQISGKKTDVHRNFEIFQFDRLISKSTLSQDEIYMFDQLFRYLADQKDYQLYKKLNDNEKGIFIVQFWKSKDPTPSTPENEYLLDIVGRFNYANNNFSWGDDEGWESDRGRVLLQYGMPDQIESHDSEPSTLPYEVWTYQMDKNYIFVFIDKNSNGYFTLTHSNKEGEVNNPTWISLVRE